MQLKFFLSLKNAKGDMEHCSISCAMSELNIVLE